MTAAPYVLARTMADAHAFARDELGLPPGHYRIVNSPSTVKGIYGTDLYLVPGWETRFDRFSMKSALRWTRLNKIDVEEWRARRLDGLEPPGEQLTILDATDFFPLDAIAEEVVEERQVAALERGMPTSLVAQIGSTEGEPKSRRRRRKRCDDCGLLIEPDEWDEHQSEHLPEEG